MTILDTLPPQEMKLVVGINSVIVGAEVPAQLLLEYHPLCAHGVSRGHQDPVRIGVDEQRRRRRLRPEWAGLARCGCRKGQGL